MTKTTIPPTPLPRKYTPSGTPQEYQCPYRDEVHTVRRWNKILWAIGTIIAAGTIGAATYSLNVAKQVGTFEATTAHLKERQSEDHEEINRLRETTAKLSNTTAELKTRLDVIDDRLERIEQSLSSQGPRKGLPFHYDK